MLSSRISSWLCFYYFWSAGILLSTNLFGQNSSFVAVSSFSLASVSSPLILPLSLLTPSSIKHKSLQGRHYYNRRDHHLLFSKVESDNTNEINENSENSSGQWTHSDIEWRLRPPEETPMVDKLKLQAGARALRAQLQLNGEPIPPVLCPRGGKAVLEAYDKNGRQSNDKNKKRIAKFGITTTRGPPAPQIDETIEDIYGIASPMNGGPSAGVAAIIYMYVEPEYRKLGIGELALEAIAAIQTVQGCDFTVLVADDDGSNKLIEWYERCGFKVAPKLQDIFGSPGGKFGITMIRPTQVRSDIFARCQIKWW